MVSICTGLSRYIPCLIPFQTFLIHQDSHKLCDSHGRVGIVQLEGCLLIELTDIGMFLLIFCDRFLNTCRYEEILLFQTKLFTCHMVVIRVQHLYQVTCQVLLLNSLLILTLVKTVKLEGIDCLCIPDS